MGGNAGGARIASHQPFLSATTFRILFPCSSYALLLIVLTQQIERSGGELGELFEMLLIVLGEIGVIVFVRDLKQAVVVSVRADQGHGQPAAHGWMLWGFKAKILPAWMRYKLRVCQAQGLVF